MENPKYVAIVDDEEVFHWIIEKNLESLTCSNNMLSFYNGDEIYEYLRKEPSKYPDIIFLDLNMPVSDGWTFLKQYSDPESGIEKNIPVYIVSSSIDPEDKKKALKYSCVKEFVSKPLSKEFLERVICR